MSVLVKSIVTTSTIASQADFSLRKLFISDPPLNSNLHFVTRQILTFKNKP